MRRDELEDEMIYVMKKLGKSKEYMDDVINHIINLPYLQTNMARLEFYNEWKDRY